MLAFEEDWIWDFWLAESEGLWHIFFLKAPKAIGDPELRHWNVSQGHAVSRDLVNWKYLGTAFTPSDTKNWDDFTTWTGSVVECSQGKWHLFYTGSSRSERGLKQRIGHAVSSDLHNWSRVGDGLALDLDANLYEEFDGSVWHERAMRDPWVMRDSDGEGWLMFFTARVSGHSESNEGGAIGVAKSKDLYTWEIRPPIYSGSFGQLEVPQVVRFGSKWYCLFCTRSCDWSQGYRETYCGPPVSGTHYLIADSLAGPWNLANGPFLDGSEPSRRYAGKVVKHDGQLLFLGFLDRSHDGSFIGAVSDPLPVKVEGDGRLVILNP